MKGEWKSEGDRRYVKDFGPIRATMIASRDENHYVSHFYCYLSAGQNELFISIDEIGGDPLADDLDKKAMKLMTQKVKMMIRSWAK